MKFLHLLSVLNLSMTFVSADITQYVNDLPACGLQCIIDSIAKSTCALTNSTCICTEPNLKALTNTCILQNCTVIEAFQVANVTDLSCGVPEPSRKAHLVGTSGLAVVALIAVTVRLFSRLKYEGSLMIDDWIMVFVGISMIVFCALGTRVAVIGFGTNIWTMGTKNIIEALRIFFIAEMFYITILAFTKISILMFYLRIFPSETFRKICCAILVWILITYFVILGLTIFQCVPVDYNWLGWQGNQRKPKCMNVNTLTYSSSSVNIAQDFAVLGLPLPWLLRLHIGWKRKANVLIMFSLGIFICITSIIRLTKLVAFTKTTNPTWDYVDTVYWTAIETYVSVIVPSLPAVRILLAKRYPKMFSMDTEADSRRHTYERGEIPTFNQTRPSATKSSLVSNSEHDVEADYFPNRNLKLGDKIKGEVYTDVAAGGRRKSSDLELMDLSSNIMVDTETRVEDHLPNSHSWRERDIAPVEPGTAV